MEYSQWSRKFLTLFEKIMLIGELSNRTQLSRDTIRFYEKKGLIKGEPSKSEFNNYKNYTEDVLQRLLLIKKTKSFGFSLNEIAEILELIDINKANCSFFNEKVREKISTINNKIKELEDTKNLIISRVQEAKNVCVNIDENYNCPILESNL